jgi:hypothetical protein
MWSVSGTEAGMSKIRLKSVPTEIGLAMVLVVSTCISGCGNGRLPTYHAGGRVIFPDGSPLQGANIEFAPRGGTIKTSARAVTEADGTFRLSTFGNGDGALAGLYRVSLIPARRRGEPGGTAARRLDRKYQDPNSSGLEATVSPDSPNEFEFVVQSSK